MKDQGGCGSGSELDIGIPPRRRLPFFREVFFELIFSDKAAKYLRHRRILKFSHGGVPPKKINGLLGEGYLEARTPAGLSTPQIETAPEGAASPENCASIRLI